MKQKYAQRSRVKYQVFIFTSNCSYGSLSLIIWPTTGFSKLVDRDTILAKILPCVQALSTDSSQHVRAALGNHISGLAPLLGKEATIDHLLPLFLQLLKDDFPDVRLNIISKLELVNNGTFIVPRSQLQILMEGSNRN
jgi:serine/threonine-protein phosphatase 2A regulatory subunit A